MNNDRITINDWGLISRTGNEIIVGQSFAYVKSDLFHKPELSWIKLLFGNTATSRSHVLSLLGPETLSLPGAMIRPLNLPKLRLASITSDKALYREHKDNINLLILDPLAVNSDTIIEVYLNGGHFSRHTVHLNSNGAGTLTLSDLPTGSYEIRFPNAPADEPACAFTVAEYRLAPLVASLLDKSVAGEKLTLKIRLETFGAPVEGSVQLELIDRGQRLATNRTDALEGILTTTFALSGEGPHAINIQLVNDPSKTATIPIVGSRASERSQTTFSALGVEVTGSLLPSEGSRPVRGIFLEEGAQVTTPFRLQQVDSKKARITATNSAESVVIVVMDQTFPMAKPDALNPNTATHPAHNDEVYRFGEKLFQERKYAQARMVFEEKRAELTQPHANYAYYVACCYAREGDPKAALRALRTAIEDGWRDFNHMINDEDLASLNGYEPYELLKTGGRKQHNFELLSAGEEIEIDIPAPASILAIGAYINGNPWEGWAAVISPSEIAPQLVVPEKCRPGSEVTIEVNCPNANDNSSVYLIVKDARLLSADTPNSRLAGQLKSFVDKSTKELFIGEPTKRLSEMVPPPPPQMLGAPPGFGGGMPPPRPMMMPMPASAPMRSVAAIPMAMASALDDMVTEAVPMVKSVLTKSAPKKLARTRSAETEEEGGDSKSSKPATVDDPEVLFAALVPVNNGSAKVTLRLGEAFADYIAEAFVINGLDWTSVESHFRAEKELFASLDLPVFVHDKDTAIGRVQLGSISGQLNVHVTCNGETVPLAYKDKLLEEHETIHAHRAEVTFLVRHGDYEVMVEDPTTKRVDYAAKRVDLPGKLQYLTRAIHFLKPGESISLDSGDNIKALKVLPGLDKPFKVLVDATANYGHACCEQTAAIMLSACAMYTFADNDPQRRNKAEAIIIAGVKREQSMWLEGRGFKMYPDYANEPHSYYGPKAARYLWNLSLLHDVQNQKPSPELEKAIDTGLKMAKDATAAYKLDWPPANPQNCEEAYGAVRFSNKSSAKDQALKIARKYAENSRDNLLPAPANAYFGGAVAMRAEAAFAAATLFRAGNSGDPAAALNLANKVVKDLGQEGRLYSTVDSVAAIALMSELRQARVVGGSSLLEIDGQRISSVKALELTEKINTIRSVEGITPIEVTRLLEEDWEKFASGIQIRISLEKDGRTAQRFAIGDALDLRVKLENGYKVGDILWVCLPEALSRIIGGGQVKRFSIDFAGNDQVTVPLAATSITVDREGASSPQHFAACVRNMFEEERTASAGLLNVTVVPAGGNNSSSIFGRALGVFRNLFS